MQPFGFACVFAELFQPSTPGLGLRGFMRGSLPIPGAGGTVASLSPVGGQQNFSGAGRVSGFKISHPSYKSWRNHIPPVQEHREGLRAAPRPHTHHRAQVTLWVGVLGVTPWSCGDQARVVDVGGQWPMGPGQAQGSAGTQPGGSWPEMQLGCPPLPGLFALPGPTSSAPHRGTSHIPPRPCSTRGRALESLCSPWRSCHCC